MNYWEECISEAFQDAGISATKEQIEIVVSWIEGAHDNYSMAHGYDCIPNPLSLENSELKLKLEKERKKVHCKDCGGTGRLVIYGVGTSRSSDSQCSTCHGEGRHAR